MKVKSSVLLIASVMTIFGIMMIPGSVSAEVDETNTVSTTTVTPLNEEVSLQRTVTTMNIPEDNVLPWGTVKGSASEYAERYPVIIQFYKGEDPVHFAQVDVKGDGSYEYKFRVRNLDTNSGQFVNVFEGQYTVKIFKVIPNTNLQA